MVYKPNQGDVYTPPANHRAATFTLESSVTVLGGCNPANLDDLPDPSTFKSILSGDISGFNSYHVVSATDVSDSAIIEGFTIQDGYCPDLTGDYASASCFGSHPPTKAGGAGMECYNADLQIRNCTFKNNQSLSGGGLRLLCNSDPLIVGCTFENNQAADGTTSGGNGGGLYMYGNCSPNVINCTFTSNHANHIGGGAAFQSLCTPEFTQCIFNDNSAGDYGGGMRLGFDCSATIRLCVFYDNSCDGGGGGFSANRDNPPDDGEVVIHSCIFWENTAASGPQLYRDADDDVTITVSYCDVQSGQHYLGGDGIITWGLGNFDQDPLFISPSTGDFRVLYTSPCLNNGDGSDLPADSADLDDDDDFDEAIPKDIAGQPRQVNSEGCVDAGAHEQQEPGTAGCSADITGSSGVPDGVVDDYDLELVDDRWGEPGGVADIAPADCGDSVVDDLLAVINAWGNCSGSLFSGGLPEWVQDCLNTCGEDTQCLVECIHSHFGN